MREERGRLAFEPSVSEILGSFSLSSYARIGQGLQEFLQEALPVHLSSCGPGSVAPDSLMARLTLPPPRQHSSQDGTSWEVCLSFQPLPPSLSPPPQVHLMPETLSKSAFPCLHSLPIPVPALLHHCHHVMKWGHWELFLGGHWILHHGSPFLAPNIARPVVPRGSWGRGDVAEVGVCATCCWLLSRPKDPAGTTHPLLPVPFQMPGITSDLGFELLPTSMAFSRAISAAIFTVQGRMQWLLKVPTEDNTEVGQESQAAERT